MRLYRREWLDPAQRGERPVLFEPLSDHSLSSRFISVMDSSKKGGQLDLDYTKMSGTELKRRIRQITRLLPKVHKNFIPSPSSPLCRILTHLC